MGADVRLDGQQVFAFRVAYLPLGPDGVHQLATDADVADERGAGEATATEFAHASLTSRGAYVLIDCEGTPDVLLLATGSEVQLALQAQAELAKAKIAVRVVSMPSTTVFDRQDLGYKLEVLPKGLPRIAIEAGVTDGWWKYGCAAVIGLDRYGESAPAGVLFKLFGFTVDNLALTVRKVLGK